MGNNSNALYVAGLLIICCLRSTHAERVFAAALDDLEPMLNTYQAVIDGIEKYVSEEKQKLSVLTSMLKMYTEQTELMSNKSHYLGNPVNVFTLVKRLTTDLKMLENVIKKKPRYKRRKFWNPDEEVLDSVAEMLLCLQETYHLNVTELAQGMLRGNFSHGNVEHVEYFKPMSESDCYMLGKMHFDKQQYREAIEWYTMGLTRNRMQGLEMHPETHADVAVALSRSYYKMNDMDSANKWINFHKTVEPSFNVTEVQKSKVEKNGNQTTEAQELKILYERLCRGELGLPDEFEKSLKCRYNTDTHPFLKLAPVKTEQLYPDPPVYMMHDVISDREIEEIIKMVKLRLEVSKVIEEKTGKATSLKSRVSKTAWLDDVSSDTVNRVLLRISQFTGLNTDAAEVMQVVNYGAGGRYLLHHDYLEDHTIGVTGNREATVLFYLSDVEQGGATVFTSLGLTVFPVRRAAIFWKNLLPTAEGDDDAIHAACPVLRGSKWVTNLWINQVGQEFHKPCRPEDDKARQHRKIPRPVPKH